MKGLASQQPTRLRFGRNVPNGWKFKNDLHQVILAGILDMLNHRAWSKSAGI